MRGKLEKEGKYELFKTTRGHDILSLDDKNYYALIGGDKGDLIIKSDSDHKKDKTEAKGKYYFADFDDDPEFQDMEHLFLQDGEKFREMILPEGFPKGSDYQKKLVREDKKLSKNKVMEHVKGKGNKGGEKQYEGKKEGLRNKSKDQLYEMAKKEGVEGRSKLEKEELIKKLEGKKNRKGGNYKEEDLHSKSKEELYELAREQEIEGRSKMDREELAKKLKKEGND